MKDKKNFVMFVILMALVMLNILLSGCAATKSAEPEVIAVAPKLTAIHQIDSFRPEAACDQALEVLNQNPYSQEFFEKVFARVVEQCQSSKASSNADIIWDHLVVPLKQSGKVPPDLAKVTWNGYFSRQFASLPGTAPVSHYCHRLPEIKNALEKEYQLKKAGFEICEQGSPEPHFLNAMYVYNTMWAVCHDTN